MLFSVPKCTVDVISPSITDPTVLQNVIIKNVLFLLYLVFGFGQRGGSSATKAR